VKIVWTDSCAPTWGWADLLDIDVEEYIVESVGYLIDETNDVVLLVMSINNEDPNKVNAPFIIPKCSIKERVALKESL